MIKYIATWLFGVFSLWFYYLVRYLSTVKDPEKFKHIAYRSLMDSLVYLFGGIGIAGSLCAGWVFYVKYRGKEKIAKADQLAASKRLEGEQILLKATNEANDLVKQKQREAEQIIFDAKFEAECITADAKANERKLMNRIGTLEKSRDNYHNALENKKKAAIAGMNEGAQKRALKKASKKAQNNSLPPRSR